MDHQSIDGAGQEPLHLVARHNGGEQAWQRSTGKGSGEGAGGMTAQTSIYQRMGIARLQVLAATEGEHRGGATSTGWRTWS